ncbi:MAG: hypothetical protein CBD68_04475 [Flavobacteriaceae bacterium TMED208]|nr:MAG: hypothetical protein CBD68_04475 [Flavobacteriaceae bacterium TMED208]|tara:strand:- start:76 stop:459 length:384 start_codon:yes stop_codon:yes gene_type:complete
MKKLIFLFISFLIISCGIQKKVTKDLYTGVYEITVFDVDQIGDVPLTLTINKNETGYISKLDMRGEAAENADYMWEVEGTKVEDEVISIEAIIASYDVDFELTIEGDEVSGSMMGMFDVEGSRVESK